MSSPELQNASPISSPIESQAQIKSKPLDRFAPVFVPSWLRTLPEPYQTYYVPPTVTFPPHDYASSVVPSIAPLPIHLAHPSLLAAQPPNTVPPPFDATRVTEEGYYASHFSQLLSLNLAREAQILKNGLIHCIAAEPSPIRLGGPNGGNDGIFRVNIPGIREDSPKLQVGDKLLFRGLDTDYQVASAEAVEAEVVGMLKAQGVVFVRSTHLMDLDRVLPKYPLNSNKGTQMWASKYQIRFYASTALACAMQDAVRSMGLLLKVHFHVPRRWLSPQKEDIPVQGPNAKLVDWVDKSLNQEQQNAVSAIVTQDHRVPYLIDGPPGTGKTKTLVEAIYQILLNDPDASILVCAPSNPAADTLARRLARLLSPTELFRLNSPKRTFAEVPDDLLLHCHIAGDAFGLPTYEQLMAKRVVVTSCLDADILNAARANNATTMQAEFEVFKAFHPRRDPDQVMPHWTHLVIDEAAQASEPEVMIPMSVVMPYPLPPGCASKDPAVVLCGDIHQLGPIIASRPARDAGLDISLLERLFESDVYMTYTPAGAGKTGSEYFTSPPCTHLIRNYRSIAPILMVPAALFYEDALLASAKDVNLIRWSRLPNPNVPILFRGCNTEDDTQDEGASWFNVGEIKHVLKSVKSILAENPDIKQNEVAVITPWREQVWKLRKALRRHGYGGVDVGNVETYQGGEFRVTILSCVRSRERFLAADREANMGLFGEAKRFNVAITRAKELLVIIGNADLLKADPHWNGLLQIAKRNNFYKGPKFELALTDVYQSRFESTLRGN